MRILPLANRSNPTSRHHRYQIDPQDTLAAEREAEKAGLQIVGVFHSHPDHPPQPSTFDRQWALPWYSYLITSVRGGSADGSRVWRLGEDRGGFNPEALHISKPSTKERAK